MDIGAISSCRRANIAVLFVLLCADALVLGPVLSLADRAAVLDQVATSAIKQPVVPEFLVALAADPHAVFLLKFVEHFQTVTRGMVDEEINQCLARIYIVSCVI